MPDPRAREAARSLELSHSQVRSGKVYYLPVSSGEALDLAREYLADPLAEDVFVGETSGSPWSVEVGFRPGVTDNEGRVAGEVLSAVLGRAVVVHSARAFRVDAVFDDRRGERLGNPLIERFRVSGSVLAAPWTFPVEGLESAAAFATVDLPNDDEGLVELSRRGLLALSLPEMRAVRDYFSTSAGAVAREALGLPGSSPTDAELEIVAQTWSEHCKHKIFNDRIVVHEAAGETVIEDGLFKTFIKAATTAIARERDWLVSVFSDNAGVIRFDDDWNLVFKVETHNSPSALEPYGGALTGIVGVNRDPAGTGLGCRLLFNTDVFCLAPPSWSFALPDGVLHPHGVMAGVRKGVEDGGNQSGVPTINGAVYFDPRFLGRPLVFCGTGGLMPRLTLGRPAHEKSILPGDLIVMVGGRVGRDGIHGATFSSTLLKAETPSGVVQIGDPITQKRALDLIQEACELGLYRAITDNGAGGISSSVGELALLSGGCDLLLEAVPLKAAALAPWEILVSESQERMTLAVPHEHWPALSALALRRGVEVAAIGAFTDSGRFVASWKGQTVASIGLAWLHQDGLPRRTIVAEAPGESRAVGGSGKLESSDQPTMASVGTRGSVDSANSKFLGLLRALNICSREGLIRQYDHEVLGGSVVKSLVGVRADGPGDAAVIRPVLDRPQAVAVSNGLGCAYGDLDPYWMAVCAVDEAVRNAVAVGANPDHLAILDNFCWPDPVFHADLNPDGKHKAWALVQASRGLHDAAIAYGTPLISGKDSVKNDFIGKPPLGELGLRPAPLGPGAASGTLKLSIPPTLLVSAIGVVPDLEQAVTMDFKVAADLVYIAGLSRDELGATEWARLTGSSGAVPTVDTGVARLLYGAVHKAMRADLVASCHDASDGGLAIALAESALAGELGVRADLSAAPGAADLSVDAALFGESGARLVLSVDPLDRERFEALFAGLPLALVGRVTADPAVDLMVGGCVAVHATVREIKSAWQESPKW